MGTFQQLFYPRIRNKNSAHRFVSFFVNCGVFAFSYIVKNGVQFATYYFPALSSIQVNQDIKKEELDLDPAFFRDVPDESSYLILPIISQFKALGFNSFRDSTILFMYYTWLLNQKPQSVFSFNYAKNDVNTYLNQLVYDVVATQVKACQKVDRALNIVSFLGFSSCSPPAKAYIKKLYDFHTSPVAVMGIVLTLKQQNLTDDFLIDRLIRPYLPTEKDNRVLSTTMGIEFEFFSLSNKRAVDAVIDRVIIMNKTHDRSIHSDDFSRGLEYTTPILSNQAELQRVLLVLDILKAAGAKTNVSCGLHFHLGISNAKCPEGIDPTAYRLELVKTFIILYYRFAEPQFEKVLRHENGFFYNVAEQYQSQSNNHSEIVKNYYCAVNKCTSLEELMKLVCPCNSRYVTLNLLAINKFGTIEVRRHDGTIDSGIVRSMAETLDRIMSAAVNQTINSFIIDPASRVGMATPPANSFFACKNAIEKKLTPSHRVLSAAAAHSLFFASRIKQAAPPDNPAQHAWLRLMHDSNFYY